MISVNRTHRHFNVDKYLDRQIERGSGNLLDMPAPAPRFRGWAVRLNDRIERAEGGFGRWLDSVDWVRFHIWMGNIGGVLLTGVALYLIFIVVNAWLSGAIERAVR